MRKKGVKGLWSQEEDAQLVKLVDQYGPRNWGIIGSRIPGRTGKSCRLRWCNQLRPDVHHRPFSPEEDDLIVRAHALHGNKWATIARLLPGRTDNAVKNRWNSSLRRRPPHHGPIPTDDGETRSGNRQQRSDSLDNVSGAVATSIQTQTQTQTTPTAAMPKDATCCEEEEKCMLHFLQRVIAQEVRRYIESLVSEANVDNP